MAVKTRIDPFDRDITLFISNEMSPRAQSLRLAEYAQGELMRGQERNRAATGAVPAHETYVDQQQGAPLDSVRPDGTIVFEFQLVDTALSVIGELLVRYSPVRSGQYQSSHILFADGVEVEPGKLPAGATEFAFVNSQPYARKIERGMSPQAPDGVYHSVAELASRRFGNIARVRFGFRSLPAGAVGHWSATGSARALAKKIRGGSAALHSEWLQRQPAIVLTVGR